MKLKALVFLMVLGTGRRRRATGTRTDGGVETGSERNVDGSSAGGR